VPTEPECTHTSTAILSHPFPSLPALLSLHVLIIITIMKLTLKQQLRPRPFTSMLGFLDLKTGVTLVVLFAVML